MKSLAKFPLLLCVLLPCAVGQIPPDPAESDAGPQTVGQTKPPSEDQQDESQHVTVDVKPGPPVIKQKDLWEKTGYFHPFVRMPQYIWQDQKAIWTSPFHTSKDDVKWWAISGGVVVALIATDKSTVKLLPNSSSPVSVSTWGSRFGSPYTLIPVNAAFYFLGSRWHDERFRETGLIGFEALIDASIVVEAVKLVADRARPLEGDGKGEFESSPNGRWGSSFPSGHAISVWAMASVIAHQYSHHKIAP